MSIARRPLQGEVQRLLLPGSLSVMPLGFTAVYYASKTVDLPEGAGAPLVVSVSVATVALATFSNALYSRRLATLAKVAAGKASPTREVLMQICREVCGIADVVFWTTAGLWLVGTSLVLSSLAVWVPSLEPMAMARLAGCSVLLCPLGASFNYVLVVLQSRRVLAKLPLLGLPLPEMVAALPRPRRRLKTRLLVFSATLVFTPSVLLSDVAISTVKRGVEATGELPASALAEVVHKAVGSVALLGAITFLSAIVTAYIAGRMLAEPLESVARYAERLASGDLLEPRIIPAEDEVWAVSAAFGTLHRQLVAVLSRLKGAGAQLSAATDQMLSMASQSRVGAEAQATSVHETTASTEELAHAAREIARRAGAVAQMAERTLSAAERSHAGARTFTDSMLRMRREHEELRAAVQTLSQRVQQIGRIVEFIDGVADKSDLLALNAELEGSRAGEVGRGFSLVAAEMRQMAENVMRSTQQIERLIDEIRDATTAAVRATESGVKATDAGVALGREVAGGLESILALARDTAQAASAISQATDQQRQSSDQLAEAMTEVLRVAEQSLQSAQQIAGSSGDLANLAREMKEMVERFRLEA